MCTLLKENLVTFQGGKLWQKKKILSEPFYIVLIMREKGLDKETAEKQCALKHGIKNVLPIPNGVPSLQLNYRPQILPARNIHDNSALKLSKEN